MTKEQWKNLYNLLDPIYLDFQKAYSDLSDGRNKKNRDAAYSNAKHEITMALLHVKDYYEAYELLTGGKEISDYQREINYSELLKIQYFDSDMRIFLKKIKNIINEE